MKKRILVGLALCFLYQNMNKIAVNAETSEVSHRMTCIIPSKSTTVYWQEVADSMFKAAEEYSIDLTAIYTDNNDKYMAMSLEEALKTAILIESEAIILSYAAVEDESIDEYLLKARENGIKVVLIDCDADASLRDAYVGIDNEEAGYALGSYILKNLGEEEHVLIALSSGYDSHLNISERIQGIRNAFAEDTERLHVTVSDLGTELDMVNQWEQAIISDEKLGAVVGINERATVVLSQVLDKNRKKEQIDLYGFDKSEETMRLIEDGKLDGVVGQQQTQMGYNSIVTALMLSEGNIPDIELTTIDYKIYTEAEGGM